MRPNPLLDLLAALLPAQERERLVRLGAEPYGWSLFLGLVELFVGTALFLSSALDSFQEMSNATATYVVEKVDPQQFNSFEARLALFGSGPIMWLTWAARPTTWLLASVPLVGLTRLVAYAVSREAVGEPLLWLALRPVQALGRLLRKSQGRLRFGPDRPDRVIREPRSDLVVLSSRPKPDWNARVTLEIQERFYRVRSAEERQVGDRWAYAYVLVEENPGEVIRSLIRYELPPSPAPARGRGSPEAKSPT